MAYKSNQTTFVLRMKKGKIDSGVNRDMISDSFPVAPEAVVTSFLPSLSLPLKNK